MADVAEMIAQIEERRAHAMRVRRAAALRGRHEALVIFSVTSQYDASLNNLTLNQFISRRASTRSSKSRGMSLRSPRLEPLVSSRYSAMTSAPGRLGASPSTSTGVAPSAAKAKNSRRRSQALSSISAGCDSHFAQDKADEARVGAEGIMVKGDHPDAGASMRTARARAGAARHNSIASPQVNPRLTEGRRGRLELTGRGLRRGFRPTEFATLGRVHFRPGVGEGIVGVDRRGTRLRSRRSRNRRRARRAPRRRRNSRSQGRK